MPKWSKRGKARKSVLTPLIIAVCLLGIAYVAATIFFSSKSLKPPPSERRRRTSTSSSRRAQREARRMDSREGLGDNVGEGVPLSRSVEPQPHKHSTAEWQSLVRDAAACAESQHELMTIPAPWPGFHALCIESIEYGAIDVGLHPKSGNPADPTSVRTLSAAPSARGASSDSGLLTGLLAALEEELGEHEFQQVDPMVSTSAYEFPPNPWRLFTAHGGPVVDDDDLENLGAGAAIYLYTGGQFIWPGVRLGHKTTVPIPVTDGSPGGHKLVTMTTAFTTASWRTRVERRWIFFAASGFTSS